MQATNNIKHVDEWNSLTDSRTGENSAVEICTAFQLSQGTAIPKS